MRSRLTSPIRYIPLSCFLRLRIVLEEIPQHHRFESEKGEVYHKLTNQSEIMMDTNSWFAMMRELHDRFSAGWDTILFDSGKAFGSDLIQGIAKEISNPVECTRFLSRLASSSRRGSFQVRTDDGGAIITSPNNVFDVGRAPTGPCFFLKGIFQGLYDVILCEDCTVNEMVCKP